MIRYADAMQKRRLEKNVTKKTASARCKGLAAISGKFETLFHLGSLLWNLDDPRNCRLLVWGGISRMSLETTLLK